MNRITIALCALIVVVLVIPFQDRNHNRFVVVPDRPGLVLDTHTGQYCNPWQYVTEAAPAIPKCSALARSWH
ncbi:MAG: hypothetical protein ABSF15_05365 [Candidatus Sulfotelmatobacter sp.]|jgi:hypothetical protein